MNRPTIAVFLACCAISAFGRMDRTRFQIGTYYLRPQAQDEAHIKAMHECGIDFVYGIQPHQRRALDLFAKNGMGVILKDLMPFWVGGTDARAAQFAARYPLEEYDACVDQLEDHPAIWMVDIGDEPNAKNFPHYGKIVELLKRRLPRDIGMYLNLYPNYASVSGNSAGAQEGQLGTKTYDEHIAWYSRDVGLDYISYDFYVYSAQPGHFDEFLGKMYDNYRVVAEECRRTNRSFWYVAQVNSSDPARHMTLNRLRFQAFTAMAFGAESIAWGCWMKGWWDNNVVNGDGTTNAHEYGILKTVNAEIKSLGVPFMRYRSVATHFVGYVGNPVKSVSCGPFGDIVCAEGGPLLVGEMMSRNGSGKKALFVVSTDDPDDKGRPARSLRLACANDVVLHRSDGTSRTTVPEELFAGVPLAANEAVMIEER